MNIIREEQIGLYRDNLSEAETLFRDNIKLANNIGMNCCKFMKDTSLVSPDDVMQVAYMSLWKACTNFDKSKGYQFATYAIPIIKGSIMNMFRDEENITTPAAHRRIRFTLKKLGIVPPLTEEDIEIILNYRKDITRKHLEEYSDVNVLSFNYTESGDDRTLSDIVPDKSFNLEDDVTFSASIDSIIENILSYVRPKAREIVKDWLLSALDGRPYKLRELSERHNLSTQYVSIVLRRTIEKLKNSEKEVKELFGID